MVPIPRIILVGHQLLRVQAALLAPLLKDPPARIDLIPEQALTIILALDLVEPLHHVDQAQFIIAEILLCIDLVLFDPSPGPSGDRLPGVVDQPGAHQLSGDLILFGAIEYWRDRLEPEAACRPPEVRLENLADIHASRHAQRVEDDLDRRAIGQERHVFDRHHTRDHTLVAVSARHLVALSELALLSHAHTHQLIDPGRQVTVLLAIEHVHIDHATMLAVRQTQ